MNRFVKLAVGTVAGLGLLLGGTAACSSSKYYEGCEVNDQFQDGNQEVQRFEGDCGYWERQGKYFISEQIVPGGIWHWWSWVTIGQNSFAPKGWMPPHGLNPPLESKETSKRRKSHEKKIEQEQKRVKKEKARQEELRKKQNQAPTGTRNGNGLPKTSSGNQGIPKGNSAPKSAPRSRP